MHYTVIVPFYNEEKNISSFNNGLINNLKKIANTNRNFEIVYVTVVKIDESVKEKKEIEKIILCDVQKEIQKNMEKAFTDLIINSGFKQIEVKNIDFEKLYNSKFN